MCARFRLPGLCREQWHLGQLPLLPPGEVVGAARDMDIGKAWGLHEKRVGEVPVNLELVHTDRGRCGGGSGRWSMERWTSGDRRRSEGRRGAGGHKSFVALFVQLSADWRTTPVVCAFHGAYDPRRISICRIPGGRFISGGF